MQTVSVRLGKVLDLDFISRFLKESKSETLRDLLTQGRKMKAIELYKQKKTSLGLAARLAGVSLSEFLDLLKEYNVPIALGLEEAKEAMRHAEKL